MDGAPDASWSFSRPFQTGPSAGCDPVAHRTNKADPIHQKRD